MWVRRSGVGEIRFSMNAGIRVWVSTQDLREHAEVERIRRMEISGQEKRRLLEEKEDAIVKDIAGTKYGAISHYAERSEGIKIDVEDIGNPEGKVMWDDVVDLTTKAPSVGVERGQEKTTPQETS